MEASKQYKIVNNLYHLFESRQDDFLTSLEQILKQISKDKYIKQMFADRYSAFFTPTRVSEVVYNILHDDREKFIQLLLEKVRSIEACFGPKKAQYLEEMGQKLLKLSKDQSQKISLQRGIIKLLRDQLDSTTQSSNITNSSDVIQVNSKQNLDLSKPKQKLSEMGHCVHDLLSFFIAFQTSISNLIRDSKQAAIKVSKLKEKQIHKLKIKSAINNDISSQMESPSYSDHYTDNDNNNSFNSSPFEELRLLKNKTNALVLQISKLKDEKSKLSNLSFENIKLKEDIKILEQELSDVKAQNKILTNFKMSSKISRVENITSISEAIGCVKEIEEQRTSLLKEKALTDLQILQMTEKINNLNNKITNANHERDQALLKYNELTRQISNHLELNNTISQLQDELKKAKLETAEYKKKYTDVLSLSKSLQK